MPTYTFRDKKTGEEQVLTMTISEAEKFSKKNKHLDWLCGAPGFGDAFKMGLSSMRPHGDFKDRIKDIKKSHIRSTIKT